MHIAELEVTGLYSFGDKPNTIELNKGLNVLIGANGSGKSNLLQVFRLLKRYGENGLAGGVCEDSIWCGNTPVGEVSVRTKVVHGSLAVDHVVYPVGGLRVTEMHTDADSMCVGIGERPAVSCSSSLSEMYRKIKVYDNWQLGRDSLVRLPQAYPIHDSPGSDECLSEDMLNLGFVLGRFFMRGDLGTREMYKSRVKSLLREYSSSLEEVWCEVAIAEERVRVLFKEKGVIGLNALRPLAQASSGDLKFLCLLTILLHPNPPPVICIEEPDAGLHPDAVVILYDLLKEASARTQVVITTNSPEMLDEFEDTPEAVLVCEKEEGVSKINRLHSTELSIWLTKYSLGTLWAHGFIGGCW